MAAKTALISATFSPKSSASPKEKPALARAPPQAVSTPTKSPISNKAVPSAATFSTAARPRERGSESNISSEPRSSSPRRMRLPASNPQMAGNVRITPSFHMA